MHTFATGFKIDEIKNGYRLTLHSPMGDYIFDLHKYQTQQLADSIIEKIYNLPSTIEQKDDHQLEFFEGEDNGL